jgi:hypothetical protein
MSTLADAEQLRDDTRARYLRDFLKVGTRKTNFAAFALSDADYIPPDQRLAVGVAFGKSATDHGLAIRVSKRDGFADRAAKELQEAAAKDGAWTDLRVVDELAVPSRTDVSAIKTTEAAKFPVGGDPLMMGVSIGHPKSPAGSLGGFVRFKGGGEGIISCCHVIANSGRGVDVSSADAAPYVYHPASIDLRGKLAPRHQIGRLTNFLMLDTTTVELDVAVATLLKHRTHLGNVIPDVPGAKNAGKRVGRPPAREDIAGLKTVAKVGRTSTYTEGRLVAGFFNDVGLTVPGLGIVYYDRLYEVESPDEKHPFAEPGDSGAAAFDAATRAAFGLVVGGGEWDDNGTTKTLVYLCDLASALDEMEVTWQ